MNINHKKEKKRIFELASAQSLKKTKPKVHLKIVKRIRARMGSRLNNKRIEKHEF